MQSIVSRINSPVLRLEEARIDPTAIRTVDEVVVDRFVQVAIYCTHRFAGAVAVEGHYSGPYGSTAPFSMLLNYFS
jgi:hypothetical protein